MKLDLSEILSNLGMRYVYEVEEPPLVDEDLECAAPILGEIVFSNTGSVLLLDGSVDTRVVLPCSRCLEYFEEEIHLPISEQFPMEARSAGPRGRQTQVVIEEDDENPDAHVLFEGPLFDLTELLRQGIMLALPTRPLHDENCEGLCPSCGTNLNEGKCDCITENINPAFSKLSTLLKDKAEG